MKTFGQSQLGSGRLEDSRFLTGRGHYLADVVPQGAWHMHFIRSPLAHAKITAIDKTAAEHIKDVHAIVTAQDLQQQGVDLAMQGSLADNTNGRESASPYRPILADGYVRFNGEPVVAVVADNAQIALDAAEAIIIDYQDLEPHLDVSAGGVAVHPQEAPDNIAFDWCIGDQNATDQAFANAHHTVKLSVHHNRVIANSMETRGCYGEIGDDGRLHLCLSSQGVWDHKEQISRHLRIDPECLRITTPDVGGGFGMKAMVYPEYCVLAAVTRMLNHSVVWLCERSEGMLSDNAGRDLVSDAEMAFDHDYRIVGYRVFTRCNLGAYNSQEGQSIQSSVGSKVLTGVYAIDRAFYRVQGIYTNTTQIDAYRGAGRPEAIYTLERTLDYAARVLGVGIWDLRRINFIPCADMPYTTVVGETYDVGDFAHLQRVAYQRAGVSDFAVRRAQSKQRGYLRGIGSCYYIESILGQSYENAKVHFGDHQTCDVYVGTQSNGQGHETVYTHFFAEHTGLPIDSIRIVQGDSDLIQHGGGTGGSRSVTIQSSALLDVANSIKTEFRPFVAALLDKPVDKVHFRDGHFVVDHSNATMTLLDAAAQAHKLQRHDLITFHGSHQWSNRSYPNGMHICEVDIDPDTGSLCVVRYYVVDDFGVLLNQDLVIGQIHGGIAQGIGQAISEHVHYDGDGNLLTATFMDYAMPRADMIPVIDFHSEPVPSVNNPIGMKGCGEAGTVGALAAVGNAVLDALWGSGVDHIDMPFTPQRVWQWLQQAKNKDKNAA